MAELVQNPGNPAGEGGRIMLKRMNEGEHALLSGWGLGFLKIARDADVLEIGCGGGANVARLLKLCPCGSVTGVDYSATSVDVSTETNRDAIDEGRASIKRENVLSLSFEDASFDAATAFETIYFWPDIQDSFKQVCRILKNGGQFFICNETDGEAAEGYDWEKNIEGLTVYKIKEVTDLLKNAGFSDVAVKRGDEKPWVCFIATK